MNKFLAWYWLVLALINGVVFIIDPSWKQSGVVITDIFISSLLFNIVLNEKVIKHQEELIDELL